MSVAVKSTDPPKVSYGNKVDPTVKSCHTCLGAGCVSGVNPVLTAIRRSLNAVCARMYRSVNAFFTLSFTLDLGSVIVPSNSHRFPLSARLYFQLGCLFCSFGMALLRCS